MERSSEFVKNKALFGGYPIQEQVDLFESLGVRYFIDLTRLGEKRTTPYTTKYTYIHYPIQDRRVPTNWKSFAQFIIKIGEIIKNLPPGQRIYVHCKGGHGRSGIVVACLLCYLYKINPPEALSKTTKYHSRRKEMREKWRRIGSPQTRSQKHFVTKFFEPLYIYKNYTKYFSAGFNNDAEFPVMVPGFGLFQTATAAFRAFKDPLNIKHVCSLETVLDAEEVRCIASECPPRNDWTRIRESVMYTILKYKFNQHDTIRTNLLNSGLRPIIVRSVDPFWGKLDTLGKNMIGKLLVKLRKEFHMNTEINSFCM
jgi:predicted NAD-dependent protein-ADP-ribosyltransferase YbiA (DUF1768 family)